MSKFSGLREKLLDALKHIEHQIEESPVDNFLADVSRVIKHAVQVEASNDKHFIRSTLDSSLKPLMKTFKVSVDHHKIIVEFDLDDK